MRRAIQTTEGLPTPVKESSENGAQVGQKPAKKAAESVLFACLLALGAFMTIAWSITLLWCVLSLVTWLID
jgi:hypothetical protein